MKELKEGIFKDSDFEPEDEDSDDQPKYKPITYKDQIREDILEQMSDSSDKKKRRKSSNTDS